MIYVLIFRVAGSLSRFIEGVNKGGGFSYSNNFDVEFYLPDELKTRLKNYGVNLDTNGDETLKLLCDEAQLPNMQAATGQITGRHLGEGLVNYPHTKIYNDFQLSWMGDANLLSLKFLNLWYTYIFNEYNAQETSPQLPSIGENISLQAIKSQAMQRAKSQRSIRLNYPEKYLSTILISKTDRNKDAANGRVPLTYMMIDAYPYSIDAVPMSYGASQIVKVTANFYYSKHLVSYNNLKLQN